MAVTISPDCPECEAGWLLPVRQDYSLELGQHITYACNSCPYQVDEPLPLD